MDADGYFADRRARRNRDSFVPTEAWIDAFEQQCSQQLLKILRRYAMRLAWVAGGLSREDASAYAEDLVQNALADTASGILRWEPAAGLLLEFLMDVIRLRARRDRKRWARQQTRVEHVSIDAIDTDPSWQLDTSLVVTPVTTLEYDDDRDQLDQQLERVRAEVRDNPLALRLLDAIAQGPKSVSEILRIANMSKSDYRAARRCLAKAARGSGRRGSLGKGA